MHIENAHFWYFLDSEKIREKAEFFNNLKKNLEFFIYWLAISLFETLFVINKIRFY